ARIGVMVAGGADVEPIHVTGKIHLPIPGGDVNSGERLRYWNHPDRGTHCDHQLGTRFHEIPLFASSFYKVTVSASASTPQSPDAAWRRVKPAAIAARDVPMRNKGKSRVKTRVVF